MMTFSLLRLNEGKRTTILAHFLALPLKDRNLRFGASLAPGGIAAYVERIDLDRDAVLGVNDDRLALVGVAHVAFEDNVAELALSVLPAHRDRGIGSALFQRALTHARSRRVTSLVMRFWSKNTPIMRIARKFGMAIVAAGGDADARLELQPAPVESIGLEVDALVEFKPSDSDRSLAASSPFRS